MSPEACNIKDGVGDWLMATGKSFRAMFAACAETNKKVTKFTPRKCTISTMTVDGKLDKQIDTMHVFETLSAVDSFGITLAPEKPAKKGKSKKKKDFYNQIEVKAGTVSIKVFSNGTIHVTGAKSPIHFVDIMDRVCSTLGVITNTPVSLHSARVCLMNANFSTQSLLPLETLRDALEEAGYMASFDPERNAGINAKFMFGTHVVTVMIFTTGSAIITGAKFPEDVAAVYDIVCVAIESLHVDLTASALPPVQVSSSVLDMYTIVDGYSSRISHLCL